MIANRDFVKFTLVPVLFMATTTPSRFGPIQANQLMLASLRSSSQSGIEPRVIEQKGPSGEVLARLRITPGGSGGEFQFEVEDFKQRVPARAVGSGKISDMEVRVQMVERSSGTRLSFRAVVNGGRSSETWITLSLDRLSFDLVVDEKVRTLGNELQRLVGSGRDDAELFALARKIDHALHMTRGYRPFIEQVKNSSAFDILSTTRSLMATVSSEGVGRNLALAAIRDAVRFLTPSAYSRASVNATKVTGSGQTLQLVTAAEHSTRLLDTHSSNLSPVQCVYNCNTQWQHCHDSCTYGGLIDAMCEIWCLLMWVLCVLDCLI